MKNWFKSKEARKITVIILILCTVLIAQIIGFWRFNKKLYIMSLEHSMEQADELSVYVEKNLQLEIDRRVHVLQVIESQLQKEDELLSDSMIALLKDLYPTSGFKLMGISDLNGIGVDSSGSRYIISYSHIEDHIKNNEIYISNVLKNENETLIFIAIPLKVKNEIRGILWGKYPLTEAVCSIELTNDSYKYFQIIDDQGSYLLSSKNKFALSNALQNPVHNIWDELSKYEFDDGVSAQKIYESVQRKESDAFYFSDQEQGYYVSYRPLDINNWYLFSVQVDEGLHEYVGHTRRIATHFFVLLTVGLLTIFSVIYNLTYTMYKRIAKQNQEIQTINVMFRVTLEQTKNIPFTIDHEQKQVVLYGYPTKDVTQYCSFEVMQPENMIKRGLVDPNSIDAYRKLYQSMIVENKKCDPVVIYSQLGKEKKWLRVSITSNAQDNPDQLIGVLEDYTEHKEKELQIETHLDDIKKIEKKSQTDFLTHLYTREAFLEKLQSALDENTEHPQTNALLILDLDHFKEINDCMGHAMGDMVLQQAANTLQNYFRQGDLVGRLGGDEFVIFARNIQNLQAFEQRIKDLNNLLYRVYRKNGKSVPTSASIGIAYTTGEHETFENLYEKADQALYKVKKTGRNGYQIYSDHE